MCVGVWGVGGGGWGGVKNQNEQKKSCDVCQSLSHNVPRDFVTHFGGMGLTMSYRGIKNRQIFVLF